jgi:hypothetical protein
MGSGERFARAVATADRAALLQLLASELDFRAMTPGRFWEADTAIEALDVILGTWFGGDRRITAIETIECDRVADLERVGYRFQAVDGGRESIIEQQAYLGVEAGAITWLRIMCSGFRPIPASR